MGQHEAAGQGWVVRVMPLPNGPYRTAEIGEGKGWDDTRHLLAWAIMQGTTRVELYRGPELLQVKFVRDVEPGERAWLARFARVDEVTRALQEEMQQRPSTGKGKG